MLVNILIGLNIVLAIATFSCMVCVAIGWTMGLFRAWNKGCFMGILYLIAFVPPIFLISQINRLEWFSTRTACKFYFGGFAGFLLAGFLLSIGMEIVSRLQE